MTAPELLELVHGLGAELVLEDDGLHYRGPRGSMTPELRAAITALKTDLVGLLERRAEGSRLWACAFARLMREAHGESPDRVRVRPLGYGLSVAMAETDAEFATLEFYRSGAPARAALHEALDRWEELRTRELRILARTCHGCGREVVAALVDAETGARFCSWECQGRLFGEEQAIVGAEE